MNPDVRGRRLDLCSCGRWVHRDDLRLATQEINYGIENNNFLTSYYNSSYWTCTAEDEGEVSVGAEPNKARYQPPWTRTTTTMNGETITAIDYVTSTAVDMTQTWSGDGVYYYSSGVNASTWTSLVVSCTIGTYHRETAPALTATMGFCDANGANAVEEMSYPFTIRSGVTLWFTKDIADLDGSLSSSALYPYVSVTADSGVKWWVDRCSIEKDATRPGNFVRTKGTAVNRTETERTLAVVKVCKKCRKQIFKDVDPNRFIEGPIEALDTDTETRVV